MPRIYPGLAVAEKSLNVSPWPRLGFGFAFLFIAASVAILVTVESARRDLTRVIRATIQVTSSEEEFWELRAKIPGYGLEAEEGPWREVGRLLDPVVETLNEVVAEVPPYSRTPGQLEELIAALERRRSVAIAAPAPEPGAFRLETEEAARILEETLVLLRAESAGISTLLGRAWTLTSCVIALSCALAVLAVWQLHRNRRRQMSLDQTRAALIESRRRLEVVIQNAPVILWAVDADGVVTLSTGKGLEALGLSDGEDVGHSVFERYEEYPEIVENMRRVLAGETISSVALVDSVAFESSYIPIRDTNGHVIGAIGVAADVTERHRAEEALLRSEQARLETQSLEALGRLAGGVAHEFSNLLTVIGGFGALAQKHLGPAHESTSDLQRILKATDQAAKLTHDLLAYSRLQPSAPRDIDLNEKVEGIAQRLRIVFDENLRITTRLHLSRVPVRIDPGRFEQVVVNLGLNARDALPRGGNLTLETSVILKTDEESFARRGFAVLRVIDDGEGMSEEVLGRAFEPFFTTKPPVDGSGLGLAACQGMIEQAGGRIEAESRPGQGTTITIELPLAAPESPVEEIAPVLPARTQRGGETILLAEDNGMVRSFAARVLRDLGHPVLEAADGPEAIELARDSGRSIDLLVTDVVMPGMDGRELAATLRRNRPGLPVLFVSGYSTEDPLETRQEGMEYLAKPFSPSELAEALRRLLETGPRPAPVLASQTVVELKRVSVE